MFKVDLSKKVIAITGAGGVICSAFAKALAENGAKVALLDINYEQAKKYADEIGEYDRKGHDEGVEEENRPRRENLG